MLTDQSTPPGFAGIDHRFGAAAGLGGGFARIHDGLAREDQLVGVGRSRQQEGPAEAEAKEDQAKGPGHGNADQYPVSKLDPGGGLRQWFSRMRADPCDSGFVGAEDLPTVHG
jgi:hypothetical protein